MLSRIFISIFLFLSTNIGFGQDLSGRWEGRAFSPNNNSKLLLIFHRSTVDSNYYRIEGKEILGDTVIVFQTKMHYYSEVESGWILNKDLYFTCMNHSFVSSFDVLGFSSALCDDDMRVFYLKDNDNLYFKCDEGKIHWYLFKPENPNDIQIKN